MHPFLEPVAVTTNANRARFEAFCRSLGPDELARDVPGSSWVVRDYIAHLATIDIWVAEWFEHLADGTPWRPRAEGGGPFSIDTWNEAHVQRRRELSVDALLEEAAEHREKLWAAVDRFTPDVLEATFEFHGHEITQLRYLELWAGHDPAHSADMLRALPERAEDEELMAWTAPFRSRADA